MSDLDTVRASAPAGVVLVETLEILNPNFPPIRITNQIEPWTATLEATAPVDAGETVTFEPLPFEAVLPDMSSGGTEVIDVLVSNVDQQASDVLEMVIDNPSVVTLILRFYLSTDTSQPAVNPPVQLSIVSGVADVESMRIKAKNEDNINQKFPRWVYNTFDHPGLAR